MNEQSYVLLRNDDRYNHGVSDESDKLGRQFPAQIIVHGTLEQANNLAEYLSNFFPGCDYMWYVDLPEGTKMPESSW